MRNIPLRVRGLAGGEARSRARWRRRLVSCLTSFLEREGIAPAPGRLPRRPAPARPQESQPGRRWSLDRRLSEAEASLCPAPRSSPSAGGGPSPVLQCGRKSQGEPGDAGVARRRPCPRARTMMRLKRSSDCARVTGAAAGFSPHAAGPPRAAKGNDGGSGRLATPRTCSGLKIFIHATTKKLSVQHTKSA